MLCYRIGVYALAPHTVRPVPVGGKASVSFESIVGIRTVADGGSPEAAKEKQGGKACNAMHSSYAAMSLVQDAA